MMLTRLVVLKAKSLKKLLLLGVVKIVFEMKVFIILLFCYSDTDQMAHRGMKGTLLFSAKTPIVMVKIEYLLELFFKLIIQHGSILHTCWKAPWAMSFANFGQVRIKKTRGSQTPIVRRHQQFFFLVFNNIDIVQMFSKDTNHLNKLR